MSENLGAGQGTQLAKSGERGKVSEKKDRTEQIIRTRKDDLDQHADG
jgi:hypothetical protein